MNQVDVPLDLQAEGIDLLVELAARSPDGQFSITPRDAARAYANRKRRSRSVSSAERALADAIVELWELAEEDRQEADEQEEREALSMEANHEDVEAEFPCRGIPYRLDGVSITRHRIRMTSMSKEPAGIQAMSLGADR